MTTAVVAAATGVARTLAHQRMTAPDASAVDAEAAGLAEDLRGDPHTGMHSGEGHAGTGATEDAGCRRRRLPGPVLPLRLRVRFPQRGAVRHGLSDDPDRRQGSAASRHGWACCARSGPADRPPAGPRPPPGSACHYLRMDPSPAASAFVPLEVAPADERTPAACGRPWPPRTPAARTPPERAASDRAPGPGPEHRMVTDGKQGGGRPPSARCGTRNARGPGIISRGLSPVCTRQDSNLQPSDP